MGQELKMCPSSPWTWKQVIVIVLQIIIVILQ